MCCETLWYYICCCGFWSRTDDSGSGRWKSRKSSRSQTKTKPRSPSTPSSRRSTVKVITAKSLSDMTDEEKEKSIIGRIQLDPGVNPIDYLKKHGFDVRLSEQIGKGGYGAVYKAYMAVPEATAPAVKPSLTGEKQSEKAATDATPAVSPPKRVNTLVACKVIEIKKGAKEEIFKDQMIRELYSQKALDHEFVVKTYDAVVLRFGPLPGGRLQTNAYIFMEYSEDGDLEAELTRNRGPLDETTAKNYFGQICSGMRYLHKNGKAHRDLKLDNVLVFRRKGESTKVCKLTDFGMLATAYKNETGYEWDNRAVGTRAYWCPEILRNVLLKAQSKPLVDYKTMPADCWALGVIAYRLLTAEYPFLVPLNPNICDPKPSNEEYISQLTDVINKMTKKDIQFPESIPKGSPAWDLITRCLEHRFNHRISIDKIIASTWLDGVTSLTPPDPLKNKK